MKEEELNQMDKEELLGVIKAQRFEIERLHSIIKEARKYIESNYFYTSQGMKKANETIFGMKLLEILDKVEENK